MSTLMQTAYGLPEAELTDSCRPALAKTNSNLTTKQYSETWENFQRLVTSGLTPDKYSEAHRLVRKIAELSETAPIETIQQEREKFWKSINDESAAKRAYAIPWGYHGDAMMMQDIYDHRLTGDRVSNLLDEYYYSLAGPQMAIERRDLLAKIIREEEALQNRRLQIAVVASGPGAEIALAQELGSRSHFYGIDRELKALEFSAKKANLRPIQASARVLPFENGRFDLVICGGLFDYYKNKHVPENLDELLRVLRAGGRAVVGNISDTHAPESRDFIEAIQGWYLEHRSPRTMRRLALKTRLSAENFKTSKDSRKQFLYLDARLPEGDL